MHLRRRIFSLTSVKKMLNEGTYFFLVFIQLVSSFHWPKKDSEMWKHKSVFFFSVLLGYIHCTGGYSLWQFQIGLHCTLVRLSPASLHPPQLPPTPLKAIVRGFIVLFRICIWSPSAIFPHLHLLHSPSPL
jgi:hypothetical protein